VAFETTHSAAFTRALESLRACAFRPELEIEESPAPQRLAPFAVALSAEVIVDDEEVANGRFVLLHDPDGVDEWDGTFRIVTFIRATLDPESATDPMLADVGWSWLTDALEGVTCTALGATITTNSSQSYGTMSARTIEGSIELRGSWTPLDNEMEEHVRAWARTLEMAAGLEPIPDGVSMLRRSTP